MLPCCCANDNVIIPIVYHLNDTLYVIDSLTLTPSFQAFPTCSPTAQNRLSGMVRRKGRIFFTSGLPFSRYFSSE